MLRIVAAEQSEQDALKLDLDALVREGARRMLLAALRAEVDEYVGQHADHRDDAGHALVVRNGVAEPRTVTTAAGELEIQAPRVHDRRDGRRFTSAILPPWARRSPKVTEVLPVLYLRGLSTKDFEPAMAEFFGSEAGLSASTIQRLTREWTAELAGFRQRDLSQVDYVYLWADGVVRHEAPFHRVGGRSPPASTLPPSTRRPGTAGTVAPNRSGATGSSSTS
jgi:putative transposase